MKCPKCEARVQKAVLAIDGVTDAKADHKACTVTINASDTVSDETLRKAITDAGYTCA
ncbi:MAG: heavy-metal-associated domain-containing protein [Desulfovibrio sp.]|nr:heavy-metal-associated domain-containing protein [Desulfovibrio sp.]